MKFKLLLFSLLLIIMASCKKKLRGNDEDLTPVDIKSKVLTPGLTLPWEIIYGPDNMIWMTEKGGRISRVDPSNGQVSTLFTIPDVRTNGEGGLLGMVLHPDFNTTPHVFVVYGYGTTYQNKVVRYTFTNNTLSSPQLILDQIPAASIHNGARLVISAGKLYISTGDAANTSLPQNDASLAGKILRVNLDGSIPADNPIPNNALWSKGHRNPQGLVMVGNKLFAAEHGPDKDDEINAIEKGKNYGWPTVNGLCNDASETTFCTQNNIKESIMQWTPTIAPSGLDYYNSTYIPQFKNSLLLAVLKGSKIVQLQLDDTQSKILAVKDFYVNEYGRFRDLAISPTGKIYACTSNGNDDKIIEIYK